MPKKPLPWVSAKPVKRCPVCSKPWLIDSDRLICDSLGHTGIAARGAKVTNPKGLATGWRPQAEMAADLATERENLIEELRNKVAKMEEQIAQQEAEK